MCKLKASEIIEQSCCGQGLIIGCDKWKLAARVALLEQALIEIIGEKEFNKRFADLLERGLGL